MDDKFQIGLTSIERGDYRIVRPDCPARSGAYVVEDNATKLRGLISVDNEEIMPCVFDRIDVKLYSSTIETQFIGRYYEFGNWPLGYEFEEYEIGFNGGIWLYELREYDTRDNSQIFNHKCLDETTQQLIALLNVKHAVKQEE